MSTYSQRFRMMLAKIERHVQKCDEMKSYQENFLVITFVSFSTNLHWKYLYFPKSKILDCSSSLGLFLIDVCVFFTCINKHSRFVTTSFENRTISKINNRVHFYFHFHFHFQAESFSTFFNGNDIEE